MKDWKAQSAARTAAAAAIHAAFPHLVPAGTKVDSLQAAAKNIRIELKRAFPKIKFGVRSSRFSMGDSIEVSWTDGPTVDQVEAITDRYVAGRFDGMEDLYKSERNAWRDAFGNSKYINCSREHSDAALHSAIRTVRAQYAGNLAERGIVEIDLNDLRAGRLYQVEVMTGGSLSFWSLQSLIYRTVNKRTWVIASRDWLPVAKVGAEGEVVA